MFLCSYIEMESFYENDLEKMYIRLSKNIIEYLVQQYSPVSTLIGKARKRISHCY